MFNLQPLTYSLNVKSRISKETTQITLGFCTTKINSQIIYSQKLDQFTSCQSFNVHGGVKIIQPETINNEDH